MEAVENGATLYISSENGVPEPFYGSWSGITLETISKTNEKPEMIADDFRFVCDSQYRLSVSVDKGEVLAENQKMGRMNDQILRLMTEGGWDAVVSSSTDN